MGGEVGSRSRGEEGGDDCKHKNLPWVEFEGASLRLGVCSISITRPRMKTPPTLEPVLVDKRVVILSL